MNMKKKFLICICVTIQLMFSGCGAGNPDTSESLTTESVVETVVVTEKQERHDFNEETNQQVSINSFALSIPANWDEETGKDGFIYYYFDDSFLTLNCYEVDSEFTESSNEEFMESFKSSFNNCKYLSSDVIHVGNLSGFLNKITCSKYEIDYEGCVVILDNSGNLICLSLLTETSSTYRHDEDFQSVINSIKFIPEKQENVDVAEEQENENVTEESSEGNSQVNGPFFSYSGNGDDIISDVHTDSISYAHIIHNGDGHFAVKGHYGSSYDLLVNTTEPYDGLTLIYPNQDYMFEVTARGDWSIELFEVGTSSTDSFSGNSDFVSPIFVKASSVYEVTTVGGGHFALKGWTDSGYDLLVNTTDENYSGKVLFKKDGEYAFFEVNASREWEIKPSK